MSFETAGYARVEGGSGFVKSAKRGKLKELHLSLTQDCGSVGRGRACGESLQVRYHREAQFEQFVGEDLGAELRQVRRQKRRIRRESDSLGLGSWRAFLRLKGPGVLHRLEPCHLETSHYSLTCYITFPIVGGFWLGMGSSIARLFITQAPSKWLRTAQSSLPVPSFLLS